MASNQKKKGLNKNMLVMVLLVPLLVLVGVVAGYYILPSGDEGKEVSAEDEQVEEEVVIPLEEFLVNLNPASNTNHYVRMTVALGTTHERGEDIIPANLERIRDAIIYTTTRQTRDSLFDESGRLVLKGELVEAINGSLGLEVISNLYVTEFVVQ